MASADGGGPATATRSRRRQRPKSSESLTQQPKAKRQRLPLTEQTFVNPDAPPEMAQVKDEKVATLNSRKNGSDTENHDRHQQYLQPQPQPSVRRESMGRIKKPKHSDRAANKGDGSLLLASTSAYSVSRLPALPDKIRADWTSNQHADISAYGYALSLTQTHALVWPYGSTAQSPETFTFTLPSTSKPSDPLPVGSLVSPSAASSEPGLVIVMAGTGKVVYWETISSAATFAFINKDRAGIEGAVGGMSAGEKVVAITSAEPAGFILTFNSGRLAFLTVRDAYGRPAISVQFLRAGVSTSSSGLFGSIRHAFSHLSLRGDIAAVRADRSSRVGERNVVSMTKKARLQAWRLHRSGHHEALAEVEARDTIVSAIQEFDDVSRDFPAESFEALDLTFTPHGLEDKYLDLSRLSTVMSNDDPLVQHLVLLVSFTKRTTSRYVLVEAVLSSDGCRVGMIRPLTSYSSPLIPTSDSQVCKPRIYLPRPALVAFAVFDRAAVVASVAATPESPDTQLQSDSHILPASYEDVVDFGEDNHDILGSGIEELTSHTHNHEDSRVQRQRSKNPAALLLVRGAGLVRVLTTDIDKLASDKPPRVSARSKLEQAVFFGAKSDNPLNFDTKSDIHFPKEEISAAALEVSQEILSSSSTYLPTVSPSTEDNLRMRSAALERLINHLRAIDADIDRATRWNLLFDAEKMHVATLLWRRHESFLAAGAANDQPSIFKAIIDSINEDEKSNPQIQKGEVDPIRHWFINDVHRLHFLVAWAYQTIKTRYKEKLLGDTDLTVQMWEAMQINTCAHNGAIDFRTQNLGTYGLAAEKLQSGIPVDGFEGLDQPWTGNYYIANNVTRLVDLTSQWVLVDHWSGKPSGSALPDRKIIGKIADDLPVLMEVMLCAILEFAKWARSTPDAENRTMGQTFADTYESSKHTLPLKLIELEKWEEAAKLARKHDSLAALAEILIRHVQELENALEAGDLTLVQAQALKNTRLAKKTQIEDCFAKYGEDFAFPAYDFLLTNHGVDEMLQFELDKFGLKTKFLRSRPELARISWIHDVQEEQDVDHAADTLLDLAFSKEQQVWNKKIELSLGKLALLAQQGDKPNGNKDFRINADEARQEQKLSKVNKELVAIKIQDELYNVVSPTTYNAIDETAALDIALDVHAKSIPKRQKALQMNFEDGMKRLLKHEALDAMTLIDLLTLIELDEDARTQIFNPFWMALKVADSVCQADEVKDAKRLIWRRAFLRDDWTKLNDTKNKNDRAVVEALAGTELFDLLVSCIQRQDKKAPFRPMQPQDALGAFVGEPDRRFRDFSDAAFKTKLLDAMKWEDKTLQNHIDKHRLAKWVQATFEEAQTEVQTQLDEATGGIAAAVDGA